MKMNDIIQVVTGDDNRIIQLILDAINTGIIIFGEDRRTIFANSKASQLLIPEKARPECLVGIHFEEMFLPSDRKILARNILKIAEIQGEFEGEVMLMRHPKSSFMALLSMSMWDVEGKRTYVVTLNDISRLKSVERVLKKSERMVYLGRMLDDISHQIRNPVLAIGGFARRLLKTRLEHPEYAEIILDEAKRLELLLNEFTEFIQLPKPKFSTEDALTVEKLVAETAMEIIDRFGATCSFQKLHRDKNKKVVTDLILLKRAIDPVVTNACEALKDSERPMEVKIGLSILDEYRGGVVIEVEDKGMGIRQPLLDRVFNPFFTTKTGHIGMGLTFTKRIMDELEGKVSLESVFGYGTKVTLEVPGDRRRIIRTMLVE